MTVNDNRAAKVQNIDIPQIRDDSNVPSTNIRRGNNYGTSLIQSTAAQDVNNVTCSGTRSDLMVENSTFSENSSFEDFLGMLMKDDTPVVKSGLNTAHHNANEDTNALTRNVLPQLHDDDNLLQPIMHANGRNEIDSVETFEPRVNQENLNSRISLPDGESSMTTNETVESPAGVEKIIQEIPLNDDQNVLKENVNISRHGRDENLRPRNNLNKESDVAGALVTDGYENSTETISYKLRYFQPLDSSIFKTKDPALPGFCVSNYAL